MLHRIRLAMQTGTFDKLNGEVEVDETFIGGKARNMHADVRARKIKRGLHGTYISVQPYHLFRYLDERVFAYNLRDLNDLGRVHGRSEPRGRAQAHIRQTHRAPLLRGRANVAM